MNQQDKELFEDILDTRSLTVIHDYTVADAIKAREDRDESDPVRVALRKIYATNCLDEIWAIAHEQLGHTEKAAELRDWIAKKKHIAGIANVLVL